MESPWISTEIHGDPWRSAEIHGDWVLQDRSPRRLYGDSRGDSVEGGDSVESPWVSMGLHEVSTDLHGVSMHLLHGVSIDSLHLHRVSVDL